MHLDKTYHFWIRRIILFVLAGITTGVLITNIPEEPLIAEYAPHMFVYIALTGVSLYFVVWMYGTELGLAHVIGMLGFFTFPKAAYPIILWAIFIGALIGVMLLRQRRISQSLHNPIQLYNVIFIIARVILSFFTARWVYIRLGGSVPLEDPVWEYGNSLIFPLFIYTVVYITIYFILFLLELYATQKPVRIIISKNAVLLIVILFFPIVLAWFGVESAGIVGMFLLILGLHVFSRSQQRLQRELNELQTLSVITREVRTHQDLSSLLKAVYVQTANRLNVENFTVVLVNPDNKQLEFPLVIRAGQETQNNEEAHLHNNTLIEHVLESGVPMHINNDLVRKAIKERRLGQPKEAGYSWMGAPLITGNRKLGVMAVALYDATRKFENDDLRLLNIIASSVSIALENTWLYRQQAIRLERMSALNNITSLLTGTLLPETVLDVVISSASTITEANAVAVYLFWNDDQQELPLVRSAGLGVEFTKDPPEPLIYQSTNGVLLHNRKPLAINDIRKDEHTQNLRAALIGQGMYALVELPLAIGQKSLGVLVGYYNTVQSFNNEQVEVLRGYATQAAQAIQNSRTYATTDEALNRTLEQLVALEGIGRLLTSTIDLQRICDLVLEHALAATHASGGLVALKETGSTRLMAQSGYPDSLTKQADLFENGVFAKVLAYGETRLINNVSHASDYEPLYTQTKALLSVPIRRGSEITGLISLESTQVKHFSAEDRYFVEQIANQAMIAIDNARLFQHITETRDRLQVILDAMDKGLILVDGQGRVVLANPHIKLLGLEPAQIVNRPLLSMLDDEALLLTMRLGFRSRREIETLVADIQSDDGWANYETTVFKNTSSENMVHYIEREIIPIRGAGQTVIGALLIFRDKTEEHELERAREEFSRMLVHDLRSPLTAVTTSLRLLQELITPENELHSIVHSTTDASRRVIRKLLGRVNSLLDIARMESGKLSVETEASDLALLVKNVQEELRPLSTELEIEIQIELDKNLPAVDIDSDKVERLLLNLVDNALKYSPIKSKVRVRSYVPGTNGAAIGFIRVDVMDRGPGIPDDYKQILFNEFIQVQGRERIRRGVGLGLTFCKLAVEAHGGNIWIEDNPSGGSVFAFTLPTIKMTHLPGDETIEGVAGS